MSETVTVTQLNNRVKNILAGSPAVNDIWVSGEISNLKRYSSGHYYFTLKDEGSEVRAVLFAGSRSRMDFEPMENMKVLAFGRVDMYVARGSYQFVVGTMRKSGVGDLYMRFEALKSKLEAEGLFDQSRKRPLPRYPTRVGVVTSRSGAVIHDIITTSSTRFPADIILAPAQVQGEGAAESISKGISLLNRIGVDVIIVGRGGGSIEDLWAFNEEVVARAIVSSKAPVVSAVGHETDFTIADFVSDVRAPTPTGAAAIVLRDMDELSSELNTQLVRIQRSFGSAQRERHNRLDVIDARLSPERGLESVAMRRMEVDDLMHRVQVICGDSMSDARSRLSDLGSRMSMERALNRIESLRNRVEGLVESVRLKVESNRAVSEMHLSQVSDRTDAMIRTIGPMAAVNLNGLSKRLESLNPMNVLSRGYSMVTDSDGSIVTSIGSIDTGSNITIRMRDGSAEAEVIRKELNK